MTSNQDKSIKHINKLKKHLSRTSLDNIPRNQFGRCNRQTVLTKLDIKGSKDHPEIKKAFQKVDEKLGKSSSRSIERKVDDKQIKELQNKINDLEKRIAMISSELHTYKKNDGLIKHLMATGAIAK